jgi:hypothetical protein
MKHTLLTSLAVLSLGFCGAFSLLWIRSYSHFDHYSWQRERRVAPIKLQQPLPMTLPSGTPVPTTMEIIYAPKPLIYSESGYICYTHDLAFNAGTGGYVWFGNPSPFFLPYCLLVLPPLHCRHIGLSGTARSV